MLKLAELPRAMLTEPGVAEISVVLLGVAVTVLLVVAPDRLTLMTAVPNPFLRIVLEEGVALMLH